MIKLIRLFFSETAKDTYWVFGGNFFTSFLAFIYTIFLARAFSPSDFGTFSAILAFIFLLGDVTDLGIGTSLSRFLPPFLINHDERGVKAFTKTAFLFQMKLVFCVFILVMFLSPFLSQVILKSDNSTLLFVIAAFGIVGLAVLAFSTFALSAHKKFKAVAFISALSTVFKVIFVIIFFLLGLLNVATGLIIFVLSSYIAYFVSLQFFPLDFLKIKEKKEDLIKLISFSLFMGASRIFSAIASRLDTLMLVSLSSTFEAGIYSVAFKIASIYILLASSFSMVIAPRLAGFKQISEAILYLRKIFLVVLGILLSLLVLYFISPWFVVFILGESYVLSVPVFQALLLPMAFFTMTVPPVNFLLYVLHKPQISTFNTLVQLFIIVIGNILLIPKYGYFGPVITLIMVYGFTFLSASFFSVYFLKKHNA